jgi:hypothetical protein
MELEVVDTHTGRVTKLVQNLFQLLPSWSADGRSLAYQAGGSAGSAQALRPPSARPSHA